MGASETYQYETETIKIAAIAAALGHPARILILETLKEKKYIRSVDLQKILSLSKSSVFNHVQKLIVADLIIIDFFPNEYHLRLKTDKLKNLGRFLKGENNEV